MGGGEVDVGRLTWDEAAFDRKGSKFAKTSRCEPNSLVRGNCSCDPGLVVEAPNTQCVMDRKDSADAADSTCHGSDCEVEKGNACSAHWNGLCF